MMNRIMLFALLAICISASGQSVNDYKYALVPAKFEFQKEDDQYKLNTYTKMFLQKYGFETWLDNESIPAEVANSNCNKVYVDVVENSNMFVTKLKVVLKDCTNKVLFTSAEGQSREKEYKTAFPQALRQAFASFDGLRYKYNGKNTKEIIAEKKVEPLESNTTNKNERGVTEEKALSAIETTTGYDIVETGNGEIGEKVLQLFKTSVKNIFIAEISGRHGALVNKEGRWFFEYYVGKDLISQNMIIPNLKPE